MSLITKNNYEAYLLDYVEETLSPDLIEELMLFFENNPELKEDLDDFKIHELTAPEFELLDKDQFKKENNLITLINYDTFLIAEIEGLNSSEVSGQLNLFLSKNSSLKKEFMAYQKTKLVALSIIFKEKESLFQKETKVISLYWWFSAVAAAVIVLFWFNSFNNSIERQYFPLAEIDEVILIEDENEDLFRFYVLDEEKLQTAIIEKKIVNEDSKQAYKIKNKIHQELKTNDDANVFASLLEQDEILDTLELKDVSLQENEIKIEEILYAENSVKITYVDEVLDNRTLPPVKKKMSKFDIFRKVIKQQVKTKILDKGRDGILFAENAKPFNFIRGKNKK
tara:strand:- start:7408 stop:8424 length:1017 start_codon:yes stop_codon:yes gene_type:complete